MEAAHLKAFTDLKLLLTAPPTLILPQLTREFEVTTDASDFAISAVLTQQDAPVAYFSAKLSSGERLLSVDEKETLAVVRALTHWRHYLYQHFTLFTDNPVVSHLMTKPNLTRRQAHWIEVLPTSTLQLCPFRASRM